MKGTDYFSQNDEEKHIINFFKGKVNKGRFLEIGAYHPSKFSNTRRLVLNGWSGVYFEPSTSVHHHFETAYSDRKDIVLDKRAVGERDEKDVIFYDSNGDAISSFDSAHKKKWEKNWGSKFKEIKVDMITFDTLFNEYGTEFDFINVDVEATNYQLFKQLDFSILNRCKLFCIEHDKHDREIELEMKKFGFRKILKNPENIILGRN